MTLSYKQAWLVLGIILNMLVWGTVYHNNTINQAAQVKAEPIKIEWIIISADGVMI